MMELKFAHKFDHQNHKSGFKRAVKMINDEKGLKEVKMKNLDTLRVNFMVAGIGGMGKSTFLKLFFKIYKKVALETSSFAFSESQDGKTLKIGEVGSFILLAEHMKLEIHLIDAPGFGDGVNNQDAIDSIKDYLVKAHKKFTALNTKVFTRQEIDAQDERIHCIFYFIPPHRMKDIDIEFIQQLSGLALIVPVIAKADTMTYHEHKAYLSIVRNNLQMLQECTDHSVIYDFHESDSAFLPPEHPLVVPVDPSDPDHKVEESVLAEELDHDANYSLETDGGEVNEMTAFSGFSVDETSGIGYADILAGLHSKHFQPAANPVLADAPSVTSETAEDHAAATTPTAALRATALPRIPNVFALVCDLNENGLREYQWGTLEINNKEHSDFRRLQELVFEDGTHLVKMRELTERMSIRLYEDSQKEIVWLKMVYPYYARVKDWVNLIVLWCVYTACGLYAVRYIGSIIFQY